MSKDPSQPAEAGSSSSSEEITVGSPYRQDHFVLNQASSSIRDKLSSSQKRFIVIVLAMIMFTHTVDFMVLIPLGPKLINIFKISPHQFSLLVSIYSLTAGIFGFLGSLLFDRLDRKHALLGSYVGFLIGTFTCAIAPNFTVLLCARAVAGAFGGLLSGISYSIVGDIFSVHERGTAMGKLMTSFSLASIVGVPFGLIVANRLGWHWPFLSVVILGLISGVLAIKVIPNVNAHLRSHYSGVFAGLTENLQDRNSRRALATTFMMVFSLYMVIPFISTYLVANTGFPEKDLPLVYLIGGLLTAFTGPMMGRICDKFGPHKVFAKTGILYFVPVFLITHLGLTPVALTLLISTCFFILSNARMVPAMTIISSSIPASRRGSFMSLNSCLQQLGSASASFAGGWLITQSLESNQLSGFSYTAYFSMAFGLFAYLFGRRIRTIS